MSKRNKILIPALITAAFVIIMISVSITYKSVTTNLAEMEYKNVLDQKKIMLQDSVDNMVRDLDIQRQQIRQNNPGISEEQEKQLAYNYLYSRIHNETFSNGAYMWVEEVKDYEGGDDYAVRIIHPNLTNTEGAYLSTKDTDVKGKKLYKEQLDGIKANGRIFQFYYFPKLHSDKITKKVAYSRLYKDYDWIISMGINMDEISDYSEVFSEKFESYVMGVVVVMTALIVAVTLSVLLLLSHSDSKVLKKQSEHFSNTINKDTLTGVYSRAFGDEQLAAEFSSFKKSGESPAIMMMDIDNFKRYNDTYGHDMGDLVLTELSCRIRDTIRSTDFLIRWGGDEFLGIFPGLKPNNLPEVCDKILNAAREMKLINLDKGDILATVSLGFTYFSREDQNKEGALKRADEALYQAKNKGRNRGEIIYAEQDFAEK